MHKPQHTIVTSALATAHKKSAKKASSTPSAKDIRYTSFFRSRFANARWIEEPIPHPIRTAVALIGIK